MEYLASEVVSCDTLKGFKGKIDDNQPGILQKGLVCDVGLDVS